MTAYPHRYGDTDRAVEHYATACVASAKVLRSEGLLDQAADLQAEAERARARAQVHPLDQRDQPGHPVDRATLDRDDLDRDDIDLCDPDLFDADGQVPRWWR